MGVFFFFCGCKSFLMDRLLVLLFSVTLLLATSPPRVANEACDFSGGICTVKEGCLAKSSFACTAPQEEKKDCSKDSDCSFPICCVYGPCCCLCIVPVCPVLPVSAPMPEETCVKPCEHQDFYPQQVSRAIWKPPSFSV